MEHTSIMQPRPDDIIITIELLVEDVWLTVNVLTSEILPIFSTALYKNKPVQAINIWPILDTDEVSNQKDLIYDFSLAKSGAFPWDIQARIPKSN